MKIQAWVRLLKPSLSPRFIRRKCKQSQHSQTSLIATLMMPLSVSSSIYIMYNLFAFLQLLAFFTGGTASLCISAAYIKAGFCSQIITTSSVHLIFCIEQVRQVPLRLTVPRESCFLDRHRPGLKKKLTVGNSKLLHNS